MNKLVILLVTVATGLLFVYFPRGTHNINIYKNCTGEMCAQLLWYSPGVDIDLQGIPFLTDSATLHNSRLYEANAGQITNNPWKIGANFAIGLALGLTASIFVVNRIKKKN